MALRDNHKSEPQSTPKQHSGNFTPDPWADIMTPGRSIGMSEKEVHDLAKVATMSKKKKIIIIAVTTIVILAIVLGAWVILKRATDNKMAIIKENSQATLEAPKIVDSKVKPDTSSVYKNPAADSDKVGKAAIGDTDARVDGGKIVLTSDNKESTVTFPVLESGKINATTQSCKLTGHSENCYLGDGTSNGKPVKVWAFRNAKESSLLSLESDPQMINAKGAAIAFLSETNDNGTKYHNLFIVLNNQTGVMVSSTDYKAIDALVAGDNGFFVQQAD